MKSQILGFCGAVGAWFVNNVDLLNHYLEFFSLVLGITIGIWAIIDKIKKMRRNKL